MANSEHIGKVISFLRRNYPQTDYDEIRYLGIEGVSSNYILYYEKIQRYGMCYHCANSEECAEYGDQCDRLPSSDKYNDYLIKVQNGVVSEIYDGNREIRSRFRNDNLIWYGCEQRWISKQELENIQYDEEEERKRAEIEYKAWEDEYERQLKEAKCIIIDIKDFIKDYDIVQGKITFEFNYKVIEQIEQFPISNLVVYIYGGYHSYSMVESLVLYEDVLIKLDHHHTFDKCLKVNTYNIIISSISSREYRDKELIEPYITDINNYNYLASKVLNQDDVIELINTYKRNELLVFKRGGDIGVPNFIRYNLKLGGKRIPEYTINDNLEL